MSGKFNPFQSRQAEVLRTHTVSKRNKARKIFEKVQRKRPCIWVEIQDLAEPASQQKLSELNGEVSVVLFIEADGTELVWLKLPPILDALIIRLWKNFNKLHIIQKVENVQPGAAEPKQD